MEVNIPGYIPPPKAEPEKDVLGQSPKQDDSSILAADHDSQLEETTPAAPGVTWRVASKPEPGPTSNEESTATKPEFEQPTYRRVDAEPPRHNDTTNRPNEPPTDPSEAPSVLLLPGTVKNEAPREAVRKPTPQELFSKAMGVDIFQVMANWRYPE